MTPPACCSYSYAAWSGLFAWSAPIAADASNGNRATLWETAVRDAFLTTLDAARGAAFMPPDVAGSCGRCWSC